MAHQEKVMQHRKLAQIIAPQGGNASPAHCRRRR